MIVLHLRLRVGKLYEVFSSNCQHDKIRMCSDLHLSVLCWLSVIQTPCNRELERYTFIIFKESAMDLLWQKWLKLLENGSAT